MATPAGRTDPETLSAQGPPAFACPACSGPVEAGDSFCTTCGTMLDTSTSTTAMVDAEVPALAFRCEGCGAEIRADPGSRTTTCPFCDAPYVVEVAPRVSGRQAPEFVVGFAIAPERAEAIYRRWLGDGGLFRPGDLRRAAEAERLRGIYLPFWSFSMKADSRWSAAIGEHWYRTETYTTTDAKGNRVTRTRQVTETEWWPLEGGHHAYYSFYLVSGSKGLPQEVSEWAQPFELLALKRYAPRYLAGWLTEEYSVERDRGLAASEAEFRRRERAAIDAFLPGDRHRGLEVATEFSSVSSDLILLPIYLRSYRYRGRLYRVLINGQTGKIEGEKPVSSARIASAVGLALALIALVALLAYLLGGGGGR